MVVRGLTASCGRQALPLLGRIDPAMSVRLWSLLAKAAIRNEL